MGGWSSRVSACYFIFSYLRVLAVEDHTKIVVNKFIVPKERFLLGYVSKYVKRIKDKKRGAGQSGLRLCPVVLLGPPPHIRPSTWTALQRRSCPLVVVWCRTSTLGCPRRCGQPCCGIGGPSLSSGVERRPGAAHVVVGRPTAAFAPCHRRVVSNVHVELPTSLWAALL